MRWALILVMAAGCRQVWGLDDPMMRDGGGGDTSVDGPRDAQGGSCFERWLQGPQFGTPTALANVNTLTQERLPFVTSDGALLYYLHDNDIFVAPTMGPMGGFGMGMVEPDLSSTNNDGRVWISANGLRAFFSSNRAGGMGGGAANLWRGTRSMMGTAWSVDQMYLANLNMPGDQSDPHLSDDLLRIYFATKDLGISFASRQSISDAFGMASALPAVNGTLGQDEQPTLTQDENVIVFTSNRSGNSQLWYATRVDNNKSFGTPALLPGVNNPTRNDESPYVTPDGCQLYFASDRDGSLDLFVAGLLD